MTKSTLAATIALALTAGIAYADDALTTRSPTQVVNHHIAALLKGDATALIEDYADDAVLVLSSGVLSGKQQVQKMFASAAAQRHSGDDHAVLKIARVDGDVVIESWSHDAPNGGTVSGADVLVVRHGKILFHATMPK